MTHYATIDGVSKILYSLRVMTVPICRNVVIRFEDPIDNDKIINFGISQGLHKLQCSAD